MDRGEQRRNKAKWKPLEYRRRGRGGARGRGHSRGRGRGRGSGQGGGRPPQRNEDQDGAGTLRPEEGDEALIKDARDDPLEDDEEELDLDLMDRAGVDAAPSDTVAATLDSVDSLWPTENLLSQPLSPIVPHRVDAELDLFLKSVALSVKSQ